MHESFALLIPIFGTIGTFTVIVILRMYQNKERMAMIEKGQDPSIFNPKSNKSGVLIFAGLSIGAGVGLLVANFLEAVFGMEEVAYFSMLFIFGGFGLILGRKMANKEDSKED